MIELRADAATVIAVIVLQARTAVIAVLHSAVGNGLHRYRAGLSRGREGDYGANRASNPTRGQNGSRQQCKDLPPIHPVHEITNKGDVGICRRLKEELPAQVQVTDQLDGVHAVRTARAKSITLAGIACGHAHRDIIRHAASDIAGRAPCLIPDIADRTSVVSGKSVSVSVEIGVRPFLKTKT